MHLIRTTRRRRGRPRSCTAPPSLLPSPQFLFLPPTTLGSSILSAHSSSSSRSVPSMDVLSLFLSLRRGEGEMGDTSSAKRVSLTERTTAANPTQPKRSLAIPREPRWRALALSRWRRHCRLLSSSIHRPFRLFSAMFSFFLSFLSPVVVDQACYVHVVPRAPRWTREMGTHAARQPARQQHQPLRIKHEPVSPNGLSSQEETEWTTTAQREGGRGLCPLAERLPLVSILGFSHVPIFESE